jgi:general secretion pathway protein K
MSARTQRGLALVSVLWGVAILSVIAAAMLTSSLSTAYVGRNVWNATRGSTLDEAAINRTILALMDDRTGRQPRTDGASAMRGTDGTNVRVWVQDESGRINVNFADKDVLQSLFVSVGVERATAGTLADRIVAARGTPASAEAAGPVATAIAFRNTDDLMQVPGMSATLYGRIAPLITVYGRSGAVNTEVAPRAVLLALPGATASSVDDALRQREAARAANLPAGARATANATFMITAQSDVDGARAIRVAVVQFTGDETKPYWFLSWQ